ncbi:MAG: TIGR03560 family F420-dependent LLM class oxidoreductase [Candidatus Hodarchaeota archaeon]
MRVGLGVLKFHWPGSPANISEKLTEMAKAADKAKFCSFWVMDHLFQLGAEAGTIHGPIEAPMLEGYSTIAYLAAVTRQIKLGVAVACPVYRYPGLLVKMISTIDVLSRGRTYFGIGAGWFEREAKGLGIPFPPLRERYERLEETLQIAKQMWTGNIESFEGKYYRLEEPLNSPQPLSQPHPPILIGGHGEKKTLRLVAKYANACNLIIRAPLDEFGIFREEYESGLARLKRKLAILKQHCNAVGRPYGDIEKTVVTYTKLASDGQNPTEVIELCRHLADLGFQHVIFNIVNDYEVEPIEIMGEEIIPSIIEFE